MLLCAMLISAMWMEWYHSHRFIADHFYTWMTPRMQLCLCLKADWSVHNVCIYLCIIRKRLFFFFSSLLISRLRLLLSRFSCVLWLFATSCTNSPEVYLLERNRPFFLTLPQLPHNSLQNNQLQLMAGCAFF